jgi:preprotein translocase subunit Sss1
MLRLVVNAAIIVLVGDIGYILKFILIPLSLLWT